MRSDKVAAMERLFGILVFAGVLGCGAISALANDKFLDQPITVAWQEYKSYDELYTKMEGCVPKKIVAPEGMKPFLLKYADDKFLPYQGGGISLVPPPKDGINVTPAGSEKATPPSII